MIFREYFLKGKEPFMEYKNVIAIDAMGGDNAPAEIIKGAIEAINERADIKLRLFGDKDKIETELIIRNRLGLLIQRRRLVVMKLLQWQLRRRKILL